MDHEGCMHPDYCVDVPTCPRCQRPMTRIVAGWRCICCDFSTERDPCPHH